MKIAKIRISLWFDDQAEEAALFYTSIFKNSGIGKISYYVDSGQDIHGKPAGSIMAVEFHLEGQNFVALNGGPEYELNESISIVIDCETQEELDYYWERLSEGSDEETHHCGWLRDKYGLSWQIIPLEFYEMIQGPDAKKAKRVMNAILKMKKLDINELRKV